VVDDPISSHRLSVSLYLITLLALPERISDTYIKENYTVLVDKIVLGRDEMSDVLEGRPRRNGSSPSDR
jgi:hypothetical protein